MKIESVKDKLQKLIGRVERLAGKHVSLPILSHILLSAKRGALTARATNLDMGIEAALPVKVEREGEIAVPAGVIGPLLSNLPSVKNITLEAKDGILRVTSDISSTSIKGMGSEDFPTIPKGEGTPLPLPASALLKGFRSVQYAGALGNLKPELGSVYLACDGHELIFAATDSFRLAEKRITLKKEPQLPALLIPLKNAAEFARLLEDEAGDIKFFAGKGQCSLETPNFFVTSRLVEGNFPDYKQIIPKEFSSEAVLLKEDFGNALKVSTLFSDRFNQLKLSLDPGTKRLAVTTRNGDVGESAMSLAAALSGAAFEGNFNHRYLSDCLAAIAGDSIVFKCAGEGRPLLIKDAADTSFTYLVMPMNR